MTKFLRQQAVLKRDVPNNGKVTVKTISIRK